MICVCGILINSIPDHDIFYPHVVCLTWLVIHGLYCAYFKVEVPCMVEFGRFYNDPDAIDSLSDILNIIFFAMAG